MRVARRNAWGRGEPAAPTTSADVQMRSSALGRRMSGASLPWQAQTDNTDLCYLSIAEASALFERELFPSS